jgi:hypothetical protein
LFCQGGQNNKAKLIGIFLELFVKNAPKKESYVYAVFTDKAQPTRKTKLFITWKEKEII